MATIAVLARSERWGMLGANLLPASLFALLGVRQAAWGWEIVQTLGNDSDILLLTLQRGLACAFLLLAAALLILRAPRRGCRATRSGAVIALSGTGVPLALALSPMEATHSALMDVGSVLLVAGTAWTILSLLTLGRSFGLLPEARGLTTVGPYRYVRHPMYLGEIAAFAGAALPHLSLFAGALFGTFVVLQYWRGLNEEQVLLATFPEYHSYVDRTWRILPGLH